MSMTFSCKGPEEMRQKLDRLAEVFPEGVKEAMWQQARVIMNNALPMTPVDTGFLRSTGYVNDVIEEGGQFSVEMGFYADYSAAVHDIPPPPDESEGGRSAYHAHGTYQFLAIPFDREAPKLQERIVSRVESMLGGV